MSVDRRTYLSALGTGLFTGCLSLDTDERSTPERFEQRMTCVAPSAGQASTPREPVSTGSPPTDADWPTIYQNIRNTSYDPAVTGPGHCVEHQWTWQYEDDLPNTVGMHTSPLVIGDTLFLGDESRFYEDDSGDTPDRNTVIALDADTGTEKWRLAGSVSAAGTPTIHDDVLFVPTSHGELEAIDLNAEAVVWRRQFVDRAAHNAYAEWVSSPRVIDGIVYTGVSSKPGKLWAVDSKSGVTVWSFTAIGRNEHERTGRAGVGETETEGKMREAVAVNDESVFAACWDGRLYAVDRATGELDWAYDFWEDIPDDSPVCEAPAVQDGVVYTSLFNGGWTYAFDAATGELHWVYGKEEEHFAEGNSPTVTEEMVYATSGPSSRERYLYGLDRETGEELWKTEIGIAYRGASVDSGSVYIGEGPRILSVDRETGEPQWWFQVWGNSFSVPAVTDQAVYGADPDGHVYGFW